MNKYYFNNRLFKIVGFSFLINTYFYNLSAQPFEIPSIYSNLKYDGNSLVLTMPDGKKIKQQAEKNYYELSNFRNCFSADAKGLLFQYSDTSFSGTIYYGLIQDDVGLPMYYRKNSKVKAGKALLDINILRGLADITSWEKKNVGNLGYRIVDKKGQYIYDGKIRFINENNQFRTISGIISGPYLNCVTDSSVIVSFETNEPIDAIISINGKQGLYRSKNGKSNFHEFLLSALHPNKTYQGKIQWKNGAEDISFKTAPKKGTRIPFTFAYASDSRNGQGGGERDMFGSNAYVIKKIAAISVYEKASFLMFTGDLVNGYLNSPEAMTLQLENWKRILEPFAMKIPFYTGIGNHEIIEYQFQSENDEIGIPFFPFDSLSIEAVFKRTFVNPDNGPLSEDNAEYDPNSNKQDFPTYLENVYSFEYANIAVIVLNSNYLYTKELEKYPFTGGNLHGYIMDNQLKWFSGKLSEYQKDSSIDHIFVTIHTPFFPNGGHVSDDMYYNGNNTVRPIIKGKPVKNGIIERRDELLSLIDKNDKVIAIICGDEHNFNVLEITPEMKLYPDNYSGNKIKLNRKFWQITNGAAGAPYYAKEIAPWSESVRFFTTRYTVNFFDINGKSIKLKAMDPDVLELYKEIILK